MAINTLEDLTLLDCTLRDGGYYNNWDFNRQLVQDYLNAVAKTSVKVVELGFRQQRSDEYLGAFAYTTDDYIETFELPGNLEYAVMIDAKDALTSDLSEADYIASLFNQAQASRISLVRIATHHSKAKDCCGLINSLKQLGYKVALNIMQAAGLTADALFDIASQLSKTELEVLYFADSLGNMDPEEVSRISGILHDGWNGSLGIHTHNNKGLALINTLAAIDNGVAWVDSTVLGMGRGAGNGCTESLLLELETKIPKSTANSIHLTSLVEKHFLPLMEEYRWGTNYFYHYAAIHNIHPTYIQNLINDQKYDFDEKLVILQRLRDLESGSFKSQTLTSLTQPQAEAISAVNNSWNAHGWCSDKDVLILGAGATIKAHKTRLLQFIKAKQPIVICANISDEISEEFIDMYVACNKSRISMEMGRYNRLVKTLVIPGTVSDLAMISPAQDAFKNYGMRLEEHTFEVRDTECITPNDLVFCYAAAISIAGQARTVYLAGFDGYSNDDTKHQQMLRTIELIIKTYPDSDFVSLTPTKYPLKTRSVYEPF